MMAMALFGDIVTVSQYLMVLVIPLVPISSLPAEEKVVFFPRYLERPGRREGCDGKRGILIVRGGRGGLLTVWKKK